MTQVLVCLPHFSLAEDVIFIPHIARRNIASGDNHTPDPKLIEQMLKTSSSPDGSLSIDDYARYRVEREAVSMPPGRYFAAVSFIRDFLATGEIGLIIPSLGNGSEDVLEVNTGLDGRSSATCTDFLFVHA